MKKKFFAILLAMAVVLGMTGCGNAIPDMTEEQMQAVGEYAAITLMKYDANHRSRLVDLELLVQTEEAVQTEKPVQEPALDQQEGTGMRPTEDTPVIDSGAAEAVPASMEELLNLPEGISISYREMEICDSYPNDSGSYFSLTATSGKRLLVLKFDLFNGSGQDQYIDLLSQDPVFKVTANGNYTRRALTTMLMNDLTSYMDTLAAGSNAEAVLVVEVESDTADSLSSLRLDLENDSKTYTIQFF